MIAGEDRATALQEIEAVAARHPDDRSALEAVSWASLIGGGWDDGLPPLAFAPADEALPVAEAQTDLVVCFVDLPPAPKASGRGVAERWDIPREAHLQMLRACFGAAHRAAPAMRRVLVTNASTTLPGDLGADHVAIAPIRPDHFMYDRIRLYRDWLDTPAPSRSAAIFIDSDVITCRSPVDAFARPFSLAVTAREGWPAMPVNGGVVFARRTRAAVALLDRAVVLYDRIAGHPVLADRFRRLHGSPLSAWYGDQMALAALVGWRKDWRDPAPPTAVGPGATIRILPSDPFNHAPEARERYDWDDLARRVFVHFKGGAKWGAPQLARHLAQQHAAGIR